jgi:hypothetical protein
LEFYKKNEAKRTVIFKVCRMKLRAVYFLIDGNPFLPRIEDYLSQFKYIETDEMPEDVDMKQMEKFAMEKTPDGYRFVRIEKRYDKS